MKVEEKEKEIIAPKLFKSLYKSATMEDVTWVATMQTTMGIPDDLMNVLIQHVYLMSGGKLDVEKVFPFMAITANEWLREKITVEKAKETSTEQWLKFNNDSIEKKVRKKIEKEKKVANLLVTPVERERTRAIDEAISKGLDDAQLGKFVRMMFVGE